MLYSVASWLALLVGAAALTRYYNPELFNKLLGQSGKPVAKPNIPEQPSKKPKQKRAHTSRIDPSNSGASTPTSTAEGVAKKKRKLVSEPAAADRFTNAENVQEDEPEADNKAFAQQLARAQAGTKLEPAKSPGHGEGDRRATVKGGVGNQRAAEVAETSADNSDAAGRDADDDLSPNGSPSTATAGRAGDVSDMLEAPEAKPTTLRLTGLKSVVANTKKVASKAFEPVLTKKQRQRKAKQAEEKALREESDRIHEAKKQQQMRTARMAEGTSNQSKADSFTAKPNAWQSGNEQRDNAVKTSPPPSSLLDTFDKDSSAAPTNGAVHAEPLTQITNNVPEQSNVNTLRQTVGESKTKALGASRREGAARPVLESESSWADQVNADEQERWATELTEDAQWESVTSKKGKKKSKKDVDTGSEASNHAGRAVESVIPQQSSPSATNGTTLNDTGKPVPANNRFQMIDEPVDSTFKDAEWEA